MQDAFSVTAKDQHSVTIHNVSTNAYRGTLFITSGEIIGQPVVAGDRFTVTCMEGGLRYIKTYELPSMNFKSIIQIT